MLNFRIFGFPVTVTPWFWAISAFYGFMIYGGALATPNDLIYVALLMMCFFISVLSHELGHAFFLRKFGENYVHITIEGWGGAAYHTGRSMTVTQRVIVSLAGPAANLILCIGSYLMMPALFIAGVNPEAPIFDFLAGMYSLNKLWMIFNLIPVIPLDGGKVVMAIVKRPRTAYTVGAIFGGLGALWCLTSGIFVGAFILGMFAYQSYQNRQNSW